MGSEGAAARTGRLVQARSLKSAASTLLLLLFSTSTALAATVSRGARVAPAKFSTAQYGLMFSVPHGATYCPLPKDWVGSDHGTTVFFERPRRCLGAGYPSSGRGFEPQNLARLELFYSYWMDEDEPPDPPCNRVGRVTFLGKQRPICKKLWHGLIILTVEARYFTDIEVEADFSLITKPKRLSGDLITFRAMARSFRTCSAIWHDSNHKQKDFTTGRGPLCPPDSRWF